MKNSKPNFRNIGKQHEKIFLPENGSERLNGCMKCNTPNTPV